jgi:hypothetical protein
LITRRRKVEQELYVRELARPTIMCSHPLNGFAAAFFGVGEGGSPLSDL